MNYRVVSWEKDESIKEVKVFKVCSSFQEASTYVEDWNHSEYYLSTQFNEDGWPDYIYFIQKLNNKGEWVEYDQFDFEDDGGCLHELNEHCLKESYETQRASPKYYTTQGQSR